MSCITILLLACSAVTASALVVKSNNIMASYEARSALDANMRPDVVAKIMMKTFDTWSAEAHAFTECAATGAAFNCKESSMAFNQGCGKVVGGIMGRSIDSASEYVNDVCNEGQGWFQTTCNTVAEKMISQMSVDTSQNRDSTSQKGSKACENIWKHFVGEQEAKNYQAEQQRIADEKHEAEVAAADEKKAAAKAILDKKAAEEAKKEEQAKAAAEAENEKTRLFYAKAAVEKNLEEQKAKIATIEKESSELLEAAPTQKPSAGGKIPNMAAPTQKPSAGGKIPKH